MKTIYTALFGEYDTLFEPFIKTPGWRYVCFTDQPIKKSSWTIIKRPMLAEGAQRTARFYKIMFHRHIQSQFSIWIDASFIINCDLNQWWERFQSPMTCIKHPWRSCVYQEADVCLQQSKGSTYDIVKQMKHYMDAGLPMNNGLIQSGILMREQKQSVIDLCDLWWSQVEIYSVRDQLAFAFAGWKKPIYHLTDYDYSKDTDFLFMHHLNSPKRKNRIDYYRSLNILK